MQRHAIATLTLGTLLWGAGPALAQIGQYVPPQLNPRPRVSPYLNLFRGSPAANYYGIVRPQIETARSIQQLQQQFQAGTFVPAVLPTDPLLTGVFTTGHPVAFQNTSHFYGGRGAGGSPPPVAGGTGNPLGRADPSSSTIRPVIVTGTSN